MDLKRNMKVYFKLHDSEECSREKIVLRTGKATEKYSKAWNSQFADQSVRPTDFQRDFAEF